MYVNKTLIEDLLAFLRDLPNTSSMVDAENAVEQVKELLEFTDYTEKEKGIRQTNLKRLLGSNYLKLMDNIAKKGDVEEFEDCKGKLFAVLKSTGNTSNKSCHDFSKNFPKT